MLDTLFIYGAYSEGTALYDRIQPHIRESRLASLTGCVYRLPIGFPVYLPQGFGRVIGHVVQLDRSEFLLPLLDGFHGVSTGTSSNKVISRIEMSAVLEETAESEICQTYVYAMSADALPRSAKLIEGGDWRRSLEESPALPSRLTDRQKLYLRKLAGCSGRDIVPIDMTLYRELLSLDLVIDKGRRLALTPLGQDVARYLA